MLIRPLPLILLITLLLVLPPTAFAGDEAKEDSAAARLFREAWWSETGAGALDKAYEGYRQAVAAEGSKAVRGRALYRMAIVLQRMGRTEEGVRALERLSKEFPGQSALIVKARQRLEEWSAEDLRESFGDWYRRYQYSPAFQAKIVDRILELGSPDPNTHSTAREELLTIGEPALAALRQHSGSANSLLRNAAVDLMIKLGALPPPEHLMGAYAFHGTQAFWDLLRTAKPEQRAAYGEMAALSKDYRAAWIQAALKGPEAMVEQIAVETKDPSSATRGYLLSLIHAQPAASVFKRLRALVLDAAVSTETRVRLAKSLASLQKPDVEGPHPAGLTDADYVSWIRSEEPELRLVAWPYLADGLVRSPEAWKASAEVVSGLSPNAKESGRAVRAMLGSLRLAPADTDIEPAIEAVVHMLQGTRVSRFDWSAVWNNRTSPPPGNAALPRRVFQDAVLRARGQFVHAAPQLFWANSIQAEADLTLLLTWAQSAAEQEVRSNAIRILAAELPADIGRLTRLVHDEAARGVFAQSLFDGLQKNAMLEQLGWDQEPLTVLVEAAQATARRNQSTWIQVDGVNTLIRFSLAAFNVLRRLLGEPELIRTMLTAAQSEPGRFDDGVWLAFGNNWSKTEASSDRIVDLLEEAWPRWTPAQRVVGLEVFLVPQLLDKNAQRPHAFLRSRIADEKTPLETRISLLGRISWSDEKTAVERQAFLREILAAAGTPRALKLDVLKYLSPLTLSDVAAVFDFSNAEQVDAIVKGYLDRLPKTEAVYDALQPALRPDGLLAGRVFARFKDAPASRLTDLLTRLLEHSDTPQGIQAAFALRKRNDRADMPLWLKALVHPSAPVRVIAATQLGSLYEQRTIKALAKAVDDPSPEVRDAALASLERIEKIEKQKAHWRKYANEK